MKRIDGFSSWQCFLCCLNSTQERAHRHSLSLIFEAKLTPKINKLRKSFYIKSQLSQVSIIALLD